jgi:Flp pilus assembly protein TadB
MGLNSLTAGLNQNAITAGLIGLGTGALLGGTAVGLASRRSSKRKSKSRKRKTTRRKARKTRYARTAGKRRDTSRKRIRMTKNGQPYVILASGKARFISKRSAKTSRRRKGGRY